MKLKTIIDGVSWPMDAVKCPMLAAIPVGRLLIPTDSNMSRERSYISRDINLLVAPTGGLNNILPYLSKLIIFSIDNFIAFGKKLKPIVDLTLTTSAVSLGSVEIGLDFLLLLTELGRFYFD
jgi:hypothetical protein